MRPPRLLCSVLALFAIIPAAFGETPTVLPGTEELTWTGDLSEKMHRAALAEMDKEIAAAPAIRAERWKWDGTSRAAYEKSLAEKRERLRKIVGLIDARLAPRMERFGEEPNAGLVAESDSYRVYQVRWPVLDGVTGEGLLLEPNAAPRGCVVALPEADQTPEQLCGLAEGVAAESQYARRLAENGFLVVVPTLIDRQVQGSGDPSIAMTNEPHREWLHRQAYMMGRHIIGYEVQKVMAAVDWLTARASGGEARIGVAGYGEGGLIALYAAALDQRIHAALVSGYFKSREQTWSEPLYRNVWTLLRDFGDAEIASLVAPRGLVVEYSEEPKVSGPPPPLAGGKNHAAPGKLTTPPFADVQGELQRLDAAIPLPLRPRKLVAGAGGAPVPPGSRTALAAFAKMLGVSAPMEEFSGKAPADRRPHFQPAERELRQVKEIERHVQGLLRISDRTRNDFFLYQLMPEAKNEPWTYAQFPTKSPDSFIAGAQAYKDTFWKEIIGKIESPLPAPQARTRKIYDEPKWTGYEVVVDVGGEGFAWGVLLLPKDLRPGEKRPVIVCQHGRHGVPADVISNHKEAYHDFAARLAEQGFITFAPHNLYQKEEFYRTLSRKGNTVGLSMFSLIVRHHEQWLQWLATLPNVDAARIAFYGLSYGGESAVRIPPLLPGYCLSICSGDFNDWTRKVASTDDRHSFMYSDEWEMPYFNMGNTFSYAELTYLMFPRPFMVERGHHDGVAPDEWVAYEFAKTRRLYAQFGLADKARIEFFNGGHTINGRGTFAFLHEQLRWPAP